MGEEARASSAAPGIAGRLTGGGGGGARMPLSVGRCAACSGPDRPAPPGGVACAARVFATER